MVSKEMTEIIKRMRNGSNQAEINLETQRAGMKYWASNITYNYN